MSAVSFILHGWEWLNFTIIGAVIFFWILALREPNIYKARSLFNVTKWTAVVWIIITGVVTVIWLTLNTLLTIGSYILNLL